MKNLLITGGLGYVGRNLIKNAISWNTHATYHRHVPKPSPDVTFHQCDLRDRASTKRLIETSNPNVVIHTACSNQTQEDLDSILPAAINLAEAAIQFRFRLIHLSSDMVFDGEHAPYKEEDPPSPLTPYGVAKVQAEKVISSRSPESLIVRSSLIYGTNPPDHQTQWLLNSLEKRIPIKLFKDEIRCPIWVETLSQALLELAESTVQGILHLAGPQPLNRWDFGHFILSLHRCPHSPEVQLSSIEETGMVRPRNLTLSTQKAKKLLRTPLISPTHMKETLRKM